MLVELGLVEQRYKAVCEVLDGTTVTDVAQPNGVTATNVIPRRPAIERATSSQVRPVRSAANLT